MRQEPAEHREARELEQRVRHAWNGHALLRHFNVSGPEVASLLAIGQSFVKEKLLSGGADVAKSEVLEHIRNVLASR